MIVTYALFTLKNIVYLCYQRFISEQFVRVRPFVFTLYFECDGYSKKKKWIPYCMSKNSFQLLSYSVRRYRETR